MASSQQQPATGYRTADGGDNNQHLLIVDDDPELLRFLMEELDGAGHQCIGCDNGQDALLRWDEAWWTQQIFEVPASPTVQLQCRTLCPLLPNASRCQHSGPVQRDTARIVDAG